MGYVGVTLGIALAKAGMKVVGVEKNKEIVAKLNNGEATFEEIGLSKVLEGVVQSGDLSCVEALSQYESFDYYVITVGTPLDYDGFVNTSMIENATEQVVRNLQEGGTVIVRSTVKIGTTASLIKTILDKCGKKYYLAMCPERTLEGNALEELETLPQIVGAPNKESCEKARSLFQKLTANIISVSSYEAAEMIKLVDNSYRDLQFGFANEVARMCDHFGIKAREVIEKGGKLYPRTNVAKPGPVGGPCLEKDPHIFVQSANTFNVTPEIISSARLVNERLPVETIGFVAKQLVARGFEFGAKIAVVGLAFKGTPETDDLRGSMSKKIISELKVQIPQSKITVYDPIVCKKIIKANFNDVLISGSLDDAVRKASAVIFCNNHVELQTCNLERVMQSAQRDAFVYDYWDMHPETETQNLDWSYFSLGNTLS
jgi:UDP-N-acetyl-D-mannosaminuronic acid dehydrogenase